MSLRNENFHKKETDILQQITIASDAIRSQHKLIKFGKEAIEQTLNNTFKPNVTPLEKIVDGLKIKQTVNSVEKVQSEQKLSKVKKPNIYQVEKVLNNLRAGYRASDMPRFMKFLTWRGFD